MKFSILLLLPWVCNVHALQPTSCPTPDWFSAEFVSISDIVISSPSAAVIPDPDLTFFRGVMLFSEEEIEKVTNDAIQFFNVKYGLDFSQSEPNELGQRFYQNAVLAPFKISPETQTTVTYNRWIISGNTGNLCFEQRDGGLGVTIIDDQLLHGSYGGEDGIPITPGGGVSLLYGFYNFPVCPQQPLVIQYSSGTPFRAVPYDGIGVINCDLSHRVWGPGLAQGTVRFIPTENGRVRVVYRNIFTFPPHPK